MHFAAAFINYLEMWLIANIVFVFLALLEYALALAIFLCDGSNIIKAEADPKPIQIQVGSSSVNSQNEIAKEKRRMPRKHLILDYPSLLIFPILFASFNGFYWSVVN